MNIYKLMIEEWVNGDCKEQKVKSFIIIMKYVQVQGQNSYNHSYTWE